MRTCTFILICLLLGACGGDADFSTPEGAAAAYLEAVSDNDREALIEAVVRGEGNAMRKAAERADERGIDFNEPDSNLEDFEVLDSTINGNRANVTVKTVRELGDMDVEREEVVVCVRTGREWKVSMDSTIDANRRARTDED